MKKIIIAILCLSLFPVSAFASKYTREKRREGRLSKEVALVEPSKEAAPKPKRMGIDYLRVLSSQRDPLVEDHLWYFEGIKELGRGRVAKAEKYFQDIIAIHPDSVWVPKAHLRLAENMNEAKRYGEAEVLVRKYLKMAENHYDFFEGRMVLSRALIGKGDSKAVDLVKRMIMSASEEARLAQIKKLFPDIKRTFGVNLDRWIAASSVQYKISETFYEMSQWDEAGKRVKSRVLSRHPHGDLKNRALYLYAKALARTDHYREAVDIFESLKGAGNLPGLSYWLARTYAKLNEYDKAIAIRRSMVKRYGKSRSAADYLAKIALLEMDRGKYKKSRAEWRDVIEMRPRGGNLMEAKWYLAWCEYRLKNYDAAVQIFDWMLNHRAKRYGYRDRVRYWKARAMIESGKKAEGRAALRDLSSHNSYYGELARRRLAGDKRTAKNFAAAGGRSVAGRGGRPRVPAPRELASSSVHLARALALADMGLESLAGMEARAAAENKGAVGPMVLMEVARRSQAYDVTRRTAIRTYYASLKYQPHRGSSRAVWEYAYPNAYPAVVGDATSDSAVDSDLVWSIMKAESNYRPYVVSPAGAIGLMQLMPSTARYVAGRAIDSRTLFEPPTNIELGAGYIKKTIWPMFPGDYVSVIASYNAGERAAQRWLNNKRALHDMDVEMYVEEIPYKETCKYVKRVLENYWVMKRLY